ncbi:MAG: HD domain-containing protein [Thermoplasmatota archaeon]
MATTLRDPIHGSIRLDDWVVPIVDHPEFQRLRRIHQLGTAQLVYPGAHHTRFEHSLGAYHLAGRFAESLELDDDEALTVRAGALLHDIGHGPFSHAFEELLHDTGRRHEDTTVDLVRWGPLGDLLRQADIDPVAVSELVMGRGALAKVVSGAMDADRMDYLLRDAHYTGVKTSVDADRILRVLVRDEAHGTLLRESGILSAESLLTMRFLMYPAVYLHHTVRASERMLQAAVLAGVQEADLRLRDMERYTDDQLLWTLRQAGGRAAQLIDALDRRRLHKRAWEIQPTQLPDAASLSEPKRRDAMAAAIADAAGVEVHDVLFDAPSQPRFKELGLQVLRRSGDIVPLREASQLVAALDAARYDHWRFWVFAPKAHVDAVRKAAARELGAPDASLK